MIQTITANKAKIIELKRDVKPNVGMLVRQVNAEYDGHLALIWDVIKEDVPCPFVLDIPHEQKFFRAEELQPVMLVGVDPDFCPQELGEQFLGPDGFIHRCMGFPSRGELVLTDRGKEFNVEDTRRVLLTHEDIKKAVYSSETTVLGSSQDNIKYTLLDQILKVDGIIAYMEVNGIKVLHLDPLLS